MTFGVKLKRLILSAGIAAAVVFAASADATGVFTLEGDTVYLTPCNLPGLVMIVR